MGADIHAFIEYGTREKHAQPTRYWYNFGDRINPGRDYSIFGVLAGVRGQNTPVYPLRGIPEDSGFNVRDYTLVYVDKDSPDEGWKWERDSGTIGLNKALELDESDIYSRDADGNPALVHHPDYHSHSWLNYSELKMALLQRPYPDIATDYKAILAAMKTFEDDGYETRLIFFFDN